MFLRIGLQATQNNMGSQILELKWANHKSNMTSELQELYLSDALLDVTIACGEFSLKAHKTVLSASSTFFRKLFLDNPCKHPILIMTDIDFDDLKTIVEFMYQGEVHISEEKLTRLLKTADRLKVKGLSTTENRYVISSEQPQIDVDSHNTSSSWEHTSNQPQDIVQVENVQNSPKKPTDCTQSSASKEKPTVKVEHELQSPANDDCMYWQSECFDQASSSSVLSVCTVPAIPSVPHQQSTPSVSHQPNSSVSHQPISSVSHDTASVSHQLSILKPVSHQQSATSSVSRQLSNLSDSDQLSKPSVSHQLGVPLSSESFTYSESHTDSSTQAQVQEEGTGRDIPGNLYQSQDQSSISFPTSTKPSFDAVESLSSQSSSQGGKTDFTSFPEEKLEIINIPEASTRNTEIDLGSLPYQCDVCGKTFIKSDTFEKHLRLHDPLTKFVCTFCNYRFDRKDYLLKHLQTHTGEKPYGCIICQKRFSHHSGLISHQRTHTGEKPHQCLVCQKRFSHQSTLIYHQRTHTGEKPYQCLVCQKRFSQHSGLIYHQRTHTGEKPHQCFVCQKRFSHHSNLIAHQRTHTGEKPYQCTVCQKCFKVSSDLSRHERLHTGERPYKCHT